MVIKLPAADLKRITKKLGTVSSGNTKIDFSTGNLQVLDNDLGIQVFSSIFRTSNFSVFVNSKLFNSTVAKLAKEVVLSCEAGGGFLHITSTKFKGQIPLVKEPNWSAPADWSGDVLYSLPTNLLADLLGFTSTVTSDSATLDHTGSIRLSVDMETISADATDNFRVASATGTRSKGLGDKLVVLVPGRMARIIRELEGDEVMVSQTEPALFFESAGTSILSRNISKKFPPIENVIPKSFKLEAKVSAESLLDALQRVAPAIDPEAIAPKVELSFKDGALKLKTGGSSTGQAEDEVEVEQLVPDIFEESVTLVTHANHKFLVNFLTSVGESDIVFKANEQGKPFMLVSGNKSILIAGLKA